MGKIAIPSGNETLYFEPEEIICMKGSGCYTYIYVTDAGSEKGFKEIVASYTLKVFERLVNEHAFMRVSKYWIVGLKHVCSITKSNVIYLRIKCCTGIDLSPKFRQEFARRMTYAFALLLNLQIWLPDSFDFVC